MTISILRDGVTPETADQVDEAELVKTEGVQEDDDARLTWVEYRFPGSETIVHRSVRVELKRWPVASGSVGMF